jgi:two-component system, LytTR family, response regulator
MITAIAIDDEPMALEVIKAHAKKVSLIDLKATFVNVFEALEYLKNESIDLVFLDINMPDISGLDFSQLLPKNCQVIFTTAYSQYAVDAFNLNATDYLVKPFDLLRFTKACQKASDSLQKEEVKKEFLMVKDGYDVVKITLTDILYIQSEGNYLTIKETDRKTVTRMTMSEALETLSGSGFMKVHKSYVVNLRKIKKIERHQVTLSDKELVPIAPNYHPELLEELKKLS